MAGFDVGSIVTLEHVKPWKATQVTTGIVERWDDGQLTVRRTFRAGGRYDSLGDRIEAGDHGVIEVIEGGWVLRRAYFRADGRLIGELFNVQTPVEFLPGRVRYTDLEVDVVRYPNGRVQVVDEQDLATVVRVGAVKPELAEKALRIAHHLAEVLQAGLDWRVAAKPD